MRKHFYIFLFIFGQMLLHAQEQYLIVNDDSISIREFKEKYNANIEAEGIEKAIDNYIDFKLISQYASNIAVDTTSYYVNNLQGYYDKESKIYLENQELKQKLAKVVYEQLKLSKKIEFFALSYKNPFDSKEVEAKKKQLLELRNKICKENDSITIKQFREENKSQPFWLKPFTVPYQIEHNIYDTPIGECSDIKEQDFIVYFVKVYEEKKIDDLPPYQQIEGQIIQGLSQSSYSELLKKDLVERIQQKIDFKENQSALKEVLNLAKKHLKQKNAMALKENKIIWQMPNAQYSQQDLVTFFNKIISEGKLNSQTNFNALASYFIPIFKEDFIAKSYESNLTDFEPEFKSKMALMKETLLVNYFIEQFIYSKAAKDSVGQAEFLKTNQGKYMWPKRYDLSIYRYYNPKDEKPLYQLIKKNKPDDEILKKFNDGKKQPTVVISQGKFAEGHHHLPEGFKGDQKITKGAYLTQNAFFVINEILEAGPMNVKDAGNTLLEAYKSKYYTKVLEDLRKDAKITIPKSFD